MIVTLSHFCYVTVCRSSNEPKPAYTYSIRPSWCLPLSTGSCEPESHGTCSGAAMDSHYWPLIPTSSRRPRLRCLGLRLSWLVPCPAWQGVGSATSSSNWESRHSLSKHWSQRRGMICGIWQRTQKCPWVASLRVYGGLEPALWAQVKLYAIVQHMIAVLSEGLYLWVVCSNIWKAGILKSFRTTEKVHILVNILLFRSA